MPSIRVLLSEDHTIVRKGLRALLLPEEDIDIVGEAADGIEAVALTQELRPDIVLMDISMPNQNGLEATRQIKQLLPQVKVIILSAYSDDEYLYQTLKAGACGYIIKQAAVEELVTGIRAVADGASFLSPSISGKIINSYIHKYDQERTPTPC